MKKLVNIACLVLISLSLSQGQTRDICTKKVQIAFLIDATGSNRAGVEGLKASLPLFVEQIRQEKPDWDIEFGAVLFRDKKEEYLTRCIPFTTNLHAFSDEIKKQYAVGGGDPDEAGWEAYRAVTQDLKWDLKSDGRYLIFCADVPLQSASKSGAAGLGITSFDAHFSQIHDTDKAAAILNRMWLGLLERLDKLQGVDGCAEFLARQAEKAQKNPLTLYPNPASDAIRVTTPGEKGNLIITDLSGRLVMKSQIPASGQVTLDIQHLQDGLYHIQSRGDEGFFVGEFVKN